MIRALAMLGLIFLLVLLLLLDAGCWAGANPAGFVLGALPHKHGQIYLTIEPATTQPLTPMAAGGR